MKRNKSSGKMHDAFRNPSFVIGLVLIGIVVFCAVFASKIAPIGFEAINIDGKLKPPGYQYGGDTFTWGTDNFGRDLYARVLFGAQIALKVGFIAIVVESLIGVLVGLFAGYYGGIVDKFLMLVTDITWAMPPFILAIAIVTVIGPGIEKVIFAIAIVSWAQFARIVRAKTQGLKNMPYIEAAKALGERDISIMFKYILPNILSPIIIIATLALPSAILSASALGFLGMGTQPPTPDWGVILSEGVPFMDRAPWISIFPGVALAVTVLGFNLLGEGMRDVLDPRLKV